MRGLLKSWPALALVLAASATGLAAQESQPLEASYALSGEASWTGMAMWTDDGEFQAADVAYGSDAGLELTLRAKRPGIRAELSGRVDALTGSAASAAAAGAMAASGAFAAASADGSFLAAATVERAYLRWSPGPLAITVGRQVVNWGGALLWSPADLFAETRLVGLAPERAGTDAMRIAVPIGALGGLEAAAAPAAAFSEGRYGGRLYGYALGSDFGLQAAWDGAEGSTTLAANVKTDLIVGLWAEAGYTADDDADAAGEVEAVVGADWSIGPKVVVSGEYYFKATLLDGAIAEDSPRHHVYGSASAKAGDFISLGLMIVTDVGEGIASGTVSAVIDVAQDASLTAWIQYANGNPVTLATADSALAGVSLSLAF